MLHQEFLVLNERRKRRFSAIHRLYISSRFDKKKILETKTNKSFLFLLSTSENGQ